MGYKLAGYHHIGGVEIDPKVAEVYRKNHHPEHLYVEDLREFNERTDLPDELYELDMLDGSPPCSTFSSAGSREKAWGKEKVFREGQKKQTLDDLVFVYCDTIEKLRPRVCLLENVSGLTKGNARAYCRKIIDRLRGCGYRVQVFSLNAATMGVPQARVRTFFIGVRSEFDVPPLKIDVREDPILFGEIIDRSDTEQNITDYRFGIWKNRKSGDLDFSDTMKRVDDRDSNWNHKFVRTDRVCPTLCSGKYAYLYDLPRYVNDREKALCSTFPEDYDMCGYDTTFLTGMSVPPVMMAHISSAVWEQWLKPIKGVRDGRGD